jgi:hypothetical protein
VGGIEREVAVFDDDAAAANENHFDENGDTETGIVTVARTEDSVAEAEELVDELLVVMVAVDENEAEGLKIPTSAMGGKFKNEN